MSCTSPPLASLLRLPVDRRINPRSDKDSGVEGFPTRSWSMEMYLLNEHGEQVPASVFEKVTYELHPSFEDRAIQSASPVSSD